MAITKATASSVAPAAKGDLVVGSATNDASVLAVGSANQVLTVDSSTATGLKWAAAAAGGGANWSLFNAGGTALTGAATITVSSITASDKIMVIIAGASAGASSVFSLRFNSDSASNYYWIESRDEWGSTYSANNHDSINNMGGDNDVTLGVGSSNAASVHNGYCFITGANAAGVKAVNFMGAGTPAGGTGHQIRIGAGIWNNSATINEISVRSSSGNFDAGTMYIYISA